MFTAIRRQDFVITVFSNISVIYNPNSTGDGEDLARSLAEDLEKIPASPEVRLIPTEHAGHATELAYEIAKQYEKPLIISSSGDGGYNELIIGALRAQAEGRTPVCAVLPAGNANDHSRAVHDRPLIEAIVKNATEQIDVLELTVGPAKGEPVTSWAHSYIGIGLTPAVAVELNRTKLNRFKETWIVYRTFKDLQPVQIDVGGKILTIDSLVMANIDQMSKVLTIADKREPDDGRFDVTVFPAGSRVALLRTLLKAMTVGVKGKSHEKYEFRAVKDMVLQLDGETSEIKAGDLVKVSIAAGRLSTVR